jgi:hypothetical protein
MAQDLGRKVMMVRVSQEVDEWLHRHPLNLALSDQLQADVSALKRFIQAATDDRFKDLPFHVVVALVLGDRP